MGALLRTGLRRLVQGLWKREATRVLAEAQAQGVITAEQLVRLTAMFDPRHRQEVTP